MTSGGPFIPPAGAQAAPVAATATPARATLRPSSETLSFARTLEGHRHEAAAAERKRGQRADRPADPGHPPASDADAVPAPQAATDASVQPTAPAPAIGTALARAKRDATRAVDAHQPTPPHGTAPVPPAGTAPVPAQRAATPIEASDEAVASPPSPRRMAALHPSLRKDETTTIESTRPDDRRESKTAAAAADAAAAPAALAEWLGRLPEPAPLPPHAAAGEAGGERPGANVSTKSLVDLSAGRGADVMTQGTLDVSAKTFVERASSTLPKDLAAGQPASGEDGTALSTLAAPSRATGTATLLRSNAVVDEPSARASVAQPGLELRAPGDLPSASSAAALPASMASTPLATAPIATSPAAAPSAPTPQIVIDAPFGSPAFAGAIAASVSLLARDGVQQARLQLHPSEMGPIAVQIALDGTQARVDFTAEVAATRHAIEAGLPELASALRESGLTLAGGGVFGEAPSQQHAARREAQGRVPARLAVAHGAARDDDARVAAPRRRLVALGGIDEYA